jgi:uncharacterized membrane protein YeiH
MSSEPVTVPALALPLAIDLGAVFVFSITGAMVAVRRGYDPVGLFVLALATGLGGGLLRDGVFIQAGPPAAMQNGGYLLAVLAGCLATALFVGHVERLSKAFLTLDALGTGAYGVVGASKAYQAGLPLPACIFVGVVNATGSGLIRDVLVREEPLMLKPGQYYIIASLLGVLAFAALRMQFAVPMAWSASAGIAVTFVVRMLAITFNWSTKPVHRPRRP